MNGYEKDDLKKEDKEDKEEQKDYKKDEEKHTEDREKFIKRDAEKAELHQDEKDIDAGKDVSQKKEDVEALRRELRQLKNHQKYSEAGYHKSNYDLLDKLTEHMSDSEADEILGDIRLKGLKADFNSGKLELNPNQKTDNEDKKNSKWDLSKQTIFND